MSLNIFQIKDIRRIIFSPKTETKKKILESVVKESRIELIREMKFVYNNFGEWEYPLYWSGKIHTVPHSKYYIRWKEMNEFQLIKLIHKYIRSGRRILHLTIKLGVKNKKLIRGRFKLMMMHLLIKLAQSKRNYIHRILNEKYRMLKYNREKEVDKLTKEIKTMRQKNERDLRRINRD